MTHLNGTIESKPARPSLLAFYLPQFHPIPENDEWWGPGFTEWRNVVRGHSLYPNHHQPNIPGELGFYDLRMPEVREAQAALADAYGIYGFCYYHYWFSGRRILEMPFDEVLRSGTPDFPFCLCWANEPWTRNWDGGAREAADRPALLSGGRPQTHPLADQGLQRRALHPDRRTTRVVRLQRGRPPES